MENIPEKYNQISDEIESMYKVDQEMRILKGLKYDDETRELGLKNTKRIKEIFDDVGYPNISRFGKDTSHHFWILVQHADDDRDFQKQVLKSMYELDKSEVDKKDMAYLEDRIRVAECKPQLYGTQIFYYEDTGYRLGDIEDIENLNKRRGEIGLESIEDYIEFANMKRREVSGR